MKRISLDSAAGYANPNSLHQEGREARAVIARAQEVIASYIGATSPDQIIFAPSATLANYFLLSEFDTVAASAIEHQSILHHPNVKSIIPVSKTGELSGQNIMNVGLGSVSERGVHAPIPSPSAATAPCKDRRARVASPEDNVHGILLSIALANHEIGTIQDIKSLAKTAHGKGMLFHSDASAALTKIPIDVKDLDIDFLTLSGPKIGTPGIAALYAKNPTAQMQKFPFGTPNTPAIADLADRLSNGRDLPEFYQQFVRPLRSHLTSRLQKEIPGTTVNGSPTNTLPNILNLSFVGAEGESAASMLDLAGISVSTGSACALGQPSHVIMAITGDPVAAHNSIRISLSPSTSKADADHFADILVDIISKLRSYSTR